MYENVQSPFEQIWSLLNFGPDEVFTTMGEVRAQLATHRENINILKQNSIGSMAAIAKLSDTINPSTKDAEMHLSNLLNIQMLISQWSEMLGWCLERDVIAMEVFLDAASGHDASLN